MDMVNGRKKYLAGSGEWAVNGVDLIRDGTTTSIKANTQSHVREAGCYSHKRTVWRWCTLLFLLFGIVQ